MLLTSTGGWRSSRSRITPLIVALAYRYSQGLAPRSPRRPAEDGRRGDGRRGEHRRRPRRQVVRAGGAGAGEVRAALQGGLPPTGRREPPARALRAAALLPAAPRAGGGAARRRPDGRDTASSPSARSSRSTSRADAGHAAADARACGSARRSARPRPASGSSRCSTSPRRSRTRRMRTALPPGARADRLRGRLASGTTPERPVLDGVDLEIEPGQNVALIGHTGSGKTTLRALVPRFYDVTRGPRHDRRRRRARRDARVAPPRDRRRRPGPVPLLGDGAREHRLRRAGTRPTRTSSAPRGSRRRTNSSSSCPTATTRSSASAGSRSRAASASGSRSRAR